MNKFYITFLEPGIQLEPEGSYSKLCQVLKLPTQMYTYKEGPVKTSWIRLYIQLFINCFAEEENVEENAAMTTHSSSPNI